VAQAAATIEVAAVRVKHRPLWLHPDDVGARLRRDRAELVAEFEGAAAVVGAAERALLRSIRSCDDAELWRDDGCRSTGEWVSQRLGITHWKAARMVKASHVLETLPLTAAALEAGSLSLDKVVELTRFLTPASEKKLLRWARRATPSAIRERGNKENPVPLKEIKDAFHSRYLSYGWSIGGEWLSFEGLLPAAQGAVFEKAIERLAEQLPDAASDDPFVSSLPEDAQRGYTAYQRQADALAHMASAQIAGDQDPDRATVVVHAPLEALATDQGCGIIAGGPVLHPETARRLSCDARLQVVLHGKDGNALGIGNASQLVPWWLRRQVLERDDHRCTFPGCTARRFLHPHHIVHWARKGPTDLDNLITLCSIHHTLVHESRWSVIRSPEGIVTWFKPSGRVYDPGAPLPDPDDVKKRPPREPDEHRLIEARRYSRFLAAANFF
jgi:hypothetical protein